jgi:hypothetical protein
MLLQAIQNPKVLYDVAVGRLVELGEISMILKER